MPSTVLTSHSTLLTSSGWIEIGGAAKVAAIGVDRNGRLSVRDVETKVSDDVTGNYFLGTRAAFGAFHAETVVVDSNGNRRAVASVCDAEETQSFKWESCTYGGQLMSSQPDVESLWHALGAISLIGDKKTLVIRTFNTERAEDERFARLNRPQLEQDCGELGFEGVGRRIEGLFGTEVDLVSVDRRAYQLSLWLATCRRAAGKGYRLGFDSIQHTCSVKVDLGGDAGQIEALRTAFRAGTANRSVMAWDDRSWSPISSGFILDSQSSRNG